MNGYKFGVMYNVVIAWRNNEYGMSSHSAAIPYRKYRTVLGKWP